ncbi:MAG: OmpA family protein [Azoarcus sp.]|jgi:outer membrane protein OmpA-like peptidoglycan-associated protein|nr:OmpA family protein [Azoarcus sp.]
MSFMKSTGLLLFMLLSAQGVAQTSAAAGRELIDVASFFNGAYSYTTTREDTDKRANQIRAISNGRTVNPFVRDDLRKEDGDKEATLFYAFAASATVETFRVSGEDKYKDLTSHRFEFAVSQLPTGPFQTVAVFDTPESYLNAPSTKYDFSIPAQQKISGRYVRITLSGTKNGNYRLSSFSALGRFDQPAKLREDFGGIYTINGRPESGSQADIDMISQQKGTALFPYLILHQKAGQISGCYIYGAITGKSDGKLREVSEVLGTLEGGVENNVFRFTRTHNKDGSRSQGAMAIQPLAEGIKKGSYNNDVGSLLIQKGDHSGDKSKDAHFRVNLVRYSSTPAPCAVTGQKEKTAVENMQESLEKTGKVQLYGINFDFDSDTLRPESGAVLDEVVKLAKGNPGWKFEVGGHTDSVGAADYNLKLSDRRAASVVRYLTGKGVEAARLQSKGYGATRPLVSESTGGDAARAQNRRVELVKQ